jgi:hypothetical protein
MAIYHLSTKPISRGAGRSATAAAAYRSGELVQDLTSGEVFDYTRRRGVEHTEIVLPTSSAKLDINWARDRESLWNAAELSEKRKDARVAREYEVALPFELSREQRTELVRSFASDIANRYGVAVDFAIHKPHRSGDERNHHAHIMASTRQVTATGFGAKAAIEWSDTDRAKKGLTPAKVEVKVIRERWAALTNEHLKERGLQIRVDHRSLKEQGIEREPTTHLGPAVSALERRGIETEVGKRIAWQRQAAAQERLERAAELGKIEREKESVERSILDLSGDLKTARQGREAVAPAAPPGSKKSMEEIQAEARQRWLAERELTQGKGANPSLEEVRRQGREDWLSLRAEMAKGGLPAASPTPQKSLELERKAEPLNEEGAKRQDFSIEQIKAQGRAALETVKQEMQAEREREYQREIALQKERSKGRSRGRGRTPGDDDDRGRGGPGLGM